MSLEFINVSKCYGNVQALAEVSFRFNPGVVGLIGANGAGKTTSIRLIARHIEPDAGEILFKGKPVATYPLHAYPIACISDEPIYYEELSVEEHFQLIAAMYNKPQSDIGAIIEQMGLQEHLRKLPEALSRGTKQKLSIGCALLRDFDLLVADEPFTGLDPQQISVVKDILKNCAASGRTVLISTHLLQVVEKVCTEFILLHKGRLKCQGTLAGIKGQFGISPQAGIEEMYLHIVGEPIQGFEGDG
jgi:ABC-2 type transport system ATP-binding protein